MRPLLLTPLFFSSVYLAAATTISFRAIRSDTTILAKRSNVTGVPLENGGNVIYGTTITLGGTSFNVVLDSGRRVYFLFSSSLFISNYLSADLWVAGSVPDTQDTGTQVSVSYAVGNVNGAYATTFLSI